MLNFRCILLYSPIPFHLMSSQMSAAEVQYKRQLDEWSSLVRHMDSTVDSLRRQAKDQIRSMQTGQVGSGGSGGFASPGPFSPQGMSVSATATGSASTSTSTSDRGTPLYGIQSRGRPPTTSRSGSTPFSQRLGSGAGAGTGSSAASTATATATATTAAADKYKSPGFGNRVTGTPSQAGPGGSSIATPLSASLFTGASVPFGSPAGVASSSSSSSLSYFNPAAVTAAATASSFTSPSTTSMMASHSMSGGARGAGSLFPHTPTTASHSITTTGTATATPSLSLPEEDVESLTRELKAQQTMLKSAKETVAAVENRLESLRRGTTTADRYLS
jgi:hypothetical protein